MLEALGSSGVEVNTASSEVTAVVDPVGYSMELVSVHVELSVTVTVDILL